MKTNAERQRELEQLLRSGGKSAASVVDRYREVCKANVPLQNMAVHIVRGIVDFEKSAGLLIDDSLSNPDRQQAQAQRVLAPGYLDLQGPPRRRPREKSRTSR